MAGVGVGRGEMRRSGTRRRAIGCAAARMSRAAERRRPLEPHAARPDIRLDHTSMEGRRRRSCQPRRAAERGGACGRPGPAASAAQWLRGAGMGCLSSRAPGHPLPRRDPTQTGRAWGGGAVLPCGGVLRDEAGLAAALRASGSAEAAGLRAVAAGAGRLFLRAPRRQYRQPRRDAPRSDRARGSGGVPLCGAVLRDKARQSGPPPLRLADAAVWRAVAPARSGGGGQDH